MVTPGKRAEKITVDTSHGIAGVPCVFCICFNMSWTERAHHINRDKTPTVCKIMINTVFL